jgi:hypothetical protein
MKQAASRVLSTDYTALYPRKQNSSKYSLLIHPRDFKDTLHSLRSILILFKA